MQRHRLGVSCGTVFGVLLFSAAMAITGCTRYVPPVLPDIPKTWDEEALASLELPLASTGVPPEHKSGDYYNQMRVRPIYKSYPIYAPGKEPPGYFEEVREYQGRSSCLVSRDRCLSKERHRPAHETVLSRHVRQRKASGCRVARRTVRDMESKGVALTILLGSLRAPG